jgi:hypothetical protein
MQYFLHETIQLESPSAKPWVEKNQVRSPVRVQDAFEETWLEYLVEKAAGLVTAVDDENEMY